MEAMNLHPTHKNLLKLSYGCKLIRIILYFYEKRDIFDKFNFM